jgi:Insertion element 4 transposase N-terminal
VPRLADQVALGVLTRTFPPELVDKVVSATGWLERRHRLLPARLVVSYVLGLAPRRVLFERAARPLAPRAPAGRSIVAGG